MFEGLMKRLVSHRWRFGIYLKKDISQEINRVGNGVEYKKVLCCLACGLHSLFYKERLKKLG